MKSLVTAVAMAAFAAIPAAAFDLTFSGRDWSVKTSGEETAAPGPNIFTASSRAVFVDESGALHLTVSKAGGNWRSTEVTLKQSLGYGTYRFDIAPGASAIADNTVLGLFTYDNDPAGNYREMDIEASRWGDGRTDNLQCSVQPSDLPDHHSRFALSENPNGWIMQFTWQPGVFDCSVSDKSSGAVIGTGHITTRVPTPGNEKTHINLWQFKGKPPVNGLPSEVIIRDFIFIPPA